MFPANTKILVVDDMKTMRMVMKKILVELGFSNIVEADDGSTAWIAIEEANNSGQPFGVILSDWNMPKMQGIELLQKVRSHPKMSNTPFLLVTAESEKDQVVSAVKAGVSNYIIKPFTKDTVREKLLAVYNKITST